VLGSLITSEVDIVVISSQMPEVMTFLLKNSSSCALRGGSNSIFLCWSSMSCSIIFVISSLVVEKDLEASSSIALENYLLAAIINATLKVLGQIKPTSLLGNTNLHSQHEGKAAKKTSF